MKALSNRDRATLRAVSDAFLPADTATSTPSGGDTGVPDRIEEVMRDVLAPAVSRDLARLVSALGSGIGSFLVGGSFHAFTRLAPEARERFLLGLADSRLALRRRAFQGLKRLSMFLYYTDTRVHPGIGYADPPPARDHTPLLAPMPAWKGEAVDAIVVGSGAGGGVAAAVLAQAGKRVLVVEQAPLRGPAEFHGREADGQRDLYEGAGAFATSDQSITILAGRAAGGGTTINWMTSLVPPPWLRAEWEAMGVDGATTGGFHAHVLAVLDRAHVSLEESQPNVANAILAEGSKRLGYAEGKDWHRIPRNALGCRQRCDYCVFGCPFGAKQGTLATWLADAAAAGARFAFGAQVRRVIIERGRAVGVELSDGRQPRAPLVLLGAGAVQTAALLLRSGVRSKGIGRLYLHPATSVAGVFPQKVEMWKGPMQTVAVDRFADLDGRHHGVMFESVPGHPGLTASSLPWRGGAAAKRDMARYANIAGLLVLGRDENPGRVRVDRGGTPVVDYTISEADGGRLARGMQELARIQRAAGATTLLTLQAAGVRVEAEDGSIRDAAFDAFLARIESVGVKPHATGLFSAHQMGTCALGRDGEAPADGKTGRVWDVEGLYVVDGSAFPSPSGVNPMITIQALAHRTATRLVEAR